MAGWKARAKRGFSKMPKEEKKQMSEKRRLEALIIYPGKRTDNFQRLLKIASTQAKIKEKVKSRTRNIKVKTILFVPECGVYVAIYESPFKKRSTRPLEARGWKGSEK